MSTIEFFFDVASPYTYLAASRIDDLASNAGLSVVWKPFLLGGVFKATGNTLPAAVAPKAAYMLEDLRRLASLYDVGFSFPASNFPLNSILPQRALTALYLQDQDSMKTLAKELFRRYWSEDADLSEPDVLAQIASDVGLDGEALVAKAARQEVKDALRELTDEAVARGAFGAPTFFYDDELYFGNDRLEHILRKAVQEN